MVNVKRFLLLVVAVVLTLSFVFTVYSLIVGYSNKLRQEGVNMAVYQVTSVAQKDGKVSLPTFDEVGVQNGTLELVLTTNK